jgi:hypothetical protein
MFIQLRSAVRISGAHPLDRGSTLRVGISFSLSPSLLFSSDSPLPCRFAVRHRPLDWIWAAGWWLGSAAGGRCETEGGETARK